jgi:uncharacterized membrane protein
MTKQEFLCLLRQKLSGLPAQDIEDRLTFYGEMIDDRIEEGCSEQDAVSDIGSADEIAAQIIADIPLTRLAKERLKHKRKMSAAEIVLLALGSPIWLSLAIAALAVVLSLYVVLWSAIVSVWAVFASLAACAVGGVAAGGVLACVGNVPSGIALLGAGLVCAGLAILLHFGCGAATGGIVWLTKKIAFGIKKCFVRKEVAK